MVAEHCGFRPQGYIVVREIPSVDLLVPYLQQHRALLTVWKRRQLAAHLGREVARLHAAGIDHPDLFSKHVLLSEPEPSDPLPHVYFIDMQRSSTRQCLSFIRRAHDLASLDATTPTRDATNTDRLAFLHSYLSIAFQAWDVDRFVRAIRGRSAKLSGRRKIRQMRAGTPSRALALRESEEPL